PDPTVAASNASGQNDSAAACTVTPGSEAERRGLDAMLSIKPWAAAGVEPDRMGLGPVPASEVALGRAGIGFGNLGLIELNEAFAAQALACLREWDLPDRLDRANVNGSGISLGHPVGATGARILATLVHELRRREGRYALETMCIGGDQGITAVFEAIGN